MKTKTSSPTWLDITWYVEGFDEASQEWVRLANRDYGRRGDAITNAKDSACNDSARYRVVSVTTALVREFEPGPK